MTELREMSLLLHSLAVFRGLFKDDVFSRLSALLDAEGKQAQVGAYAAFASALFERGGNLTAYILSRVLDDENTYAVKRAQGQAVDENLETCVAQELSTLQKLSQLSAGEVKKLIGYDGYLPDWQTEEVDFKKRYAAHMNGIAKRGYGIYARYHMFTVNNGDISPVKFADPVTLSDLKGYETPRQKVIDNTRALLDGKTAANALLYGDAGTGKSSTIKAIVNEYRDEGLRLIEIEKHQFADIPHIVETLSANPLKFILFIDDLSFVQENDEYNALKAMLQGSVFARTDNIAVYATSNRRHIVKETFSDRSGDDVHRNETIQELISLSQRFGLTVGFFKPGKKEYLEIVHALKDDYGIEMDDEALDIQAERFAMMGRTPRAARQLMEHLKRMNK